MRKRLAGKRTLVTWPMRDMAFSPKRVLPCVQDTFEDVQVVQLLNAKHYFQEDAPDEVVRALTARFG